VRREWAGTAAGMGMVFFFGRAALFFMEWIEAHPIRVDTVGTAV
jgi:hypothetical protein